MYICLCFSYCCNGKEQHNIVINTVGLIATGRVARSAILLFVMCGKVRNIQLSHIGTIELLRVNYKQTVLWSGGHMSWKCTIADNGDRSLCLCSFVRSF